MTLFQAIVIGIVQGLTEFLPVSSTAHMRIVPAVLGWKDPGAAFSAVIQIGTLAAVLAYFRQDVMRIVLAVLGDLRRGKLASTPDSRLGWMICVGTIPIVVIGLLFKKHIETTLRSLWVIAAALIIVALALAVAEIAIAVQSRKRGGPVGRDASQVGWLDAIVIGLAQACALVPGTSRSGITLLGGLCCGLTREAAARFSFLLSIPSILAAAVFQTISARHELFASQSQVLNLLAGTLVAAIVGYASIAWLLGYFRKHTTAVFIVYRILLACIIIGLLKSGLLLDS